jgi:hypothetical protein
MEGRKNKGKKVQVKALKKTIITIQEENGDEFSAMDQEKLRCSKQKQI